MINKLINGNDVLLEGFLSSEKLLKALDEITSIAAQLRFKFIRIIISTYGGDHGAITDFTEAVKVIPGIQFQVEVVKAGQEGDHIIAALIQKK